MANEPTDTPSYGGLDDRAPPTLDEDLGPSREIVTKPTLRQTWPLE